MAVPGEDVYCTLVMSDSYLPGAAVLAHSLRDAGAKKRIAALITLDTLSADTITELKELYDILIPVDRIRSPNLTNLYLMDRADLAYAFTKINLWRQTQFRKIVYLDADVVVLRAPDELFELEAPFAAAPDVGWPDAFNTGVMLLTPNMGDYWALQTMAAAGDSFDGADQGLLNQYYEHKGWHRISFKYNCTPNAQYQWEPAYRHYKRDISMVHFIGKDKPWFKGRQTVGSGVYNELVGRWWATHDRHLRAKTETGHHDAQGATTQDLTREMPDEAQAAPIPQIVEPESMVVTTEAPLSEPAENRDQVEPTLSEQPAPSQERKWSAPHMEWDATKYAPPQESRPEAVNFPSQTYEFSDSRDLFQAPQSYPEPPKDMWYEVPAEKPKVTEQPKAIFPWEGRERPVATRVFASDFIPPPVTLLSQQDPAQVQQTSSVQADQAREATPSPPPAASWEDFSQRPNAWDTVPGIDTYVRGVISQQTKKGRPQSISLAGATEAISSPTLTHGERRQSLLVTDFPTAVERPSLPVTPAPIRRPSFWGEDKDAAGTALPAAEGVPNQAEWDPAKQLGQLRRSSILEYEHLTSPDRPQAQVPEREMPAHAAPLPRSSVSAVPVSLDGEEGNGVKKEEQTVTVTAPLAAPKAEKPVFTDLNFEGSKSEETKSKLAEVLSPTAEEGDEGKDPLASSGQIEGGSKKSPDLVSPVER